MNFFLYIPRVNRLLLANFKCQTYDTSRRRALKWNKSIQVHHPPAMKCLAKIRVIYIYVYIYNIYILYIMFFSWVLTLLGPYLALALWCNSTNSGRTCRWVCLGGFSGRMAINWEVNLRKNRRLYRRKLSRGCGAIAIHHWLPATWSPEMWLVAG